FCKPIAHPQALNSNLSVVDSQHFPKFFLSHDWKLLLVYSFGDDNSSYFMDNPIPLHQCFQFPVAEMGSLIAHDCSWWSKTTNNVISHKRNNHVSIVNTGWNCFHPF
ncbi:hypothetical protein PIB30_104031, partial [Stylosanthes scabra]|nr:hypothetical protein [Stylosanthes scabra]